MSTSVRANSIRAALLCVALGIAGCAADPSRVALGTTRDDVLKQLGHPTATYPSPDVPRGERLQYSQGPAGFAVNNVDLDPAGRVVDVRQELNEGLFGATIKPGEWRVPDVLRTYGRPYEITRVTSFDGDVWTWRYKQLNSKRFLYIYVDRRGMVDHYNVGDDMNDGGPSDRS